MALKEVLETVEEWAEEYRQAADEDEWEHITEQWDRPESEAEDVGPFLVEALIDVVTFLSTLRCVDEGRPVIPRVRAFLARQTYGVPDSQRAARYSVRIHSPIRPVEFFLDELSEIDMEDFHDNWHILAIEIRAIGREIEGPEIMELGRQIYEDLTFDGDPWEMQQELIDGVAWFTPLLSDEESMSEEEVMELSADEENIEE